MELTDAGRAFLEEARATLKHLDRAFETTRRASRGEQGRLCVGVTSTTPFHPLVPRAIRAFREACPMVSLTLEECLSNESIDRLRNEQMDVAFIRALLGDGHGLAVISLFEELADYACNGWKQTRNGGFARTVGRRDIYSVRSAGNGNV